MTKDVQPLNEDNYKISRTAGDGIRGDKILAQARKFSYRGVVIGSSKHKIIRYDLATNAFCVLEKEFVLIRK